MDATDPRIQWLVTQAPRWRAAGEKTLLRRTPRNAGAAANGIESSGATRDRRLPRRPVAGAARYGGRAVRSADGPSLLISTEAGGEGRNLVLPPPDPLRSTLEATVVEQRIGRLDRIGRRIPVEIAYFRPPQGIGADVVRLFEHLGVFREPLAGLDPQLARIEQALEEHAFSTPPQ